MNVLTIIIIIKRTTPPCYTNSFVQGKKKYETKMIIFARELNVLRHSFLELSYTAADVLKI